MPTLMQILPVTFEGDVENARLEIADKKCRAGKVGKAS